ncbi:16129_t:CDS:2 [Rhizophagus irregularis]|nr:16129_t:CDS:2 [Rhizophagus irregularis]
MILTSEGAIISSNDSRLTKRIPQISDSETYKSIYKLDPTGSAIFYVAGIITSFANMMGSFIVIYSTLNKIQYKSEILTPSKRFPLYMAIMDFGTSIVTLPNLFFPMQKDSLMIGNWCTSLGFITSLFIVMNMMLMASLALITYLRICKRYVMNLGKKDWILFSLILFPTLTISFVTWYLNGFGPDTFWCFINQEETGSRVNLIALIVFSYVVTIMTSFCYMSVIKRIHNAETMFADSYTKNERYKSKFYSFKTQLLSPTSDHFSTTIIDGLEIRPPSFFYGPITAPTAAQERTLKNITKATRKMSSYIFLQMLQYTPIIIYSLCILMNQMQTWVYVLTVVMLNLGGVAKSFVFMKNVPIITVVVNQKDLL